MAYLRTISVTGQVVGAQVQWSLAFLAALVTLITLAILASVIRKPRHEPEQQAAPAPSHTERRHAEVAGRREAREALALVGDALAATHNPRALMPVILNVITEATGAKGGRLLQEGQEVGWVGELDGLAGVEFDLSAGDSARATKLVLYPPEGGFEDETLKLAEWLSSQAAIALENARLHDVVQRQAITDELTGLVNRRRFLDALRAEIGRGQRLGGRISVVLADLLRAHGRDMDVAARLGGEEFAILLPETGIEGASAGAERLRRSLAQLGLPLGDNGQEVHVTASFGVAELSNGQSLDGLLRAADSALYRAKDKGKNRVEVAAADSA